MGGRGGGGFGWSPRAGESLRVETPDQRNQSHDCHSRSTPKISAYFPNFWKLNFPALSVFKAEKFECSSDGHNGELHKSYFEKCQTALEQAGYELRCEVLNCCDYNVPQWRRRAYFAGVNKDLLRVNACGVA